MFIGEYQHTIDSKGRIIMPSKFRDNLGGNFIMTKGLDNCLFVYPREEWDVLEKKLRSLPLTNRDARAFVRFFFSGATECVLDKQGRVLIPSTLREHAKLLKDAVIIGVASRIEIWSMEEWNSYNDDDSLSYDNIAEKMAELGI
ncbi:division/cell wall cluster transcriptional repressor MraZ [Schnuerera sp. xch1]|uniref:division/cell wall cluster transcriptional repressor MraZ n=1 Tax=Schnuerera sp. xch1 TaxID=2874283 RepID=UPI001CBD6C0E|nr:division/cell wall cluster transcriptional repressor MraZ [Schnuerera sp. xch1]MBZ2173667.1 division/cell wall cluster transcriptional repressor MraZ [Schnuerera sp. xch1]